jgi:large subunit ribosomal protein L23
MNANTIIKRPILTEKLSKGKDEVNRYAFEVDIRANKLEIKRAIEEAFKVKVMKVNTLTMPGKTRRLGGRQAEKQPWKKAIATLKAGDRIEVYEGV